MRALHEMWALLLLLFACNRAAASCSNSQAQCVIGDDVAVGATVDCARPVPVQVRSSVGSTVIRITWSEAVAANETVIGAAVATGDVIEIRTDDALSPPFSLVIAAGGAVDLANLSNCETSETVVFDTAVEDFVADVYTSDTNHDGKIDTVCIEFACPIAGDPAVVFGTFTVSGYTVDEDRSDMDSSSVCLRVEPTGTQTSGDTDHTPRVAHTFAVGGVRNDTSGLAFGSGVIEADDRAAPVVLTACGTIGSQDVEVVLSEDVDEPELAFYVNGPEHPGASAWTSFGQLNAPLTADNIEHDRVGLVGGTERRRICTKPATASSDSSSSTQVVIIVSTVSAAVVVSVAGAFAWAKHARRKYTAIE